MRSRLLGGCFWLGLLPAILLAGKVLAHPVVPDDHRLQAAAEQADVGRATDGIPDASAFARRPLPAGEGARGFPLGAISHDGRPAALADPLALGGDAAIPTSARLQTGINANAVAAGFDDADPLPGLQRTVVDSGLQGGAATSPRAREARSAMAAESESGEDAVAAFNQLQESVAEVIAEALDVRVGKDGRVNFSVAGVEGFHVVSTAGRVTLGLDDHAVTFVQSSDAPVGEPAPPSRFLEPTVSPAGFNPVRELVGLVTEIVQYPLLWVVVVFLLIGKIAWLVVTRRGRKRRHHSHRVSKPMRLKVKRSRARSRHKSVPATGVTGPVAASPQES